MILRKTELRSISWNGKHSDLKVRRHFHCSLFSAFWAGKWCPSFYINEMNPHSSSSCDVFQVGELWVGTCKSLLHLLSLDFLENYRVWLREQTCLCNVLVAMCLGDVPMLLQQARSFSMLILWKCNVTGLGQEPEPDHPSDLFCCQTGQTNSVEALWTFLIMNNSHFILNAWWVILKYSCWKIRFGAYFLNDLSPLSILWLGFAFKKSFHLVEGKRILFFFFFFL